MESRTVLGLGSIQPFFAFDSASVAAVDQLDVRLSVDALLQFRRSFAVVHIMGDERQRGKGIGRGNLTLIAASAAAQSSLHYKPLFSDICEGASRKVAHGTATY